MCQKQTTDIVIKPAAVPHIDESCSDLYIAPYDRCDCQKSDDYRFVYIGPPGSWTPLHHDILNRCGAPIVKLLTNGGADGEGEERSLQEYLCLHRAPPMNRL